MNAVDKALAELERIARENVAKHQAWMSGAPDRGEPPSMRNLRLALVSLDMARSEDR
jgi:hypothetical protein